MKAIRWLPCGLPTKIRWKIDFWLQYSLEVQCGMISIISQKKIYYSKPALVPFLGEFDGGSKKRRYDIFIVTP